MDRLKKALRRQSSYEPIQHVDSDQDPAQAAELRASPAAGRFSYIEYVVFVWLGIAMLWAWNMFLAAGPYLRYRFQNDRFIANNFQAAELAVSTVTNLGSMFILSKMQTGASYARRIFVSLVINAVTFTLLALSTRVALDSGAAAYFVFIMFMTFATSLATGFMQNGGFAYVAGFARPEYVQAIMLGQGIAGVLPPIVQIILVLSASAGTSNSSTSAFAYFMTATGISVLTVAAFWYLDARQAKVPTEVVDASEASPALGDNSRLDDSSEDVEIHKTASRPVSLIYLTQRLFYPWSAVFLTFAVTMVFPVFTQEIVSTNPPSSSPLFKDAAFIPLALLVWNIGDLLGRIVPLSPRLSLADRPRILLLIAIARIAFVPLYLICNIQPLEHEEASYVSAYGLGVTMPDVFYLLVVQLPFGLSNGYLGTCCMGGAAMFVEEDEREAAGGFMGLMLVAGLAAGSFLSFFIGTS